MIFFELTENREAALRERIPRKTRMSLRTALCDIKKDKSEKLSGSFFRSPVSFVLDKLHIDKWDKKELVLLVNLNAVKKKED